MIAAGVTDMAACVDTMQEMFKPSTPATIGWLDPTATRTAR